jgi:hypothetical protein
MRQLCNVAYAALVEFKDEDERREVDDLLNAKAEPVRPVEGRSPAPGGVPNVDVGKSRGVAEMMARLRQLRT